MASYTPTLGALLNARDGFAAPERAVVKILLASVPFSCHWSRLYHAIDEVTEIKGVVPAGSLIPLPLDCDPDVGTEVNVGAEEVLSKIPSANILHLASHGFQNRTDPLQSGFAMRDRMLTVSDLMALNLPKAFLAFLSACETAMGDEKQPDQAVHLAATMLFAGFRSVVGTMW